MYNAFSSVHQEKEKPTRLAWLCNLPDFDELQSRMSARRCMLLSHNTRQITLFEDI